MPDSTARRHRSVSPTSNGPTGHVDRQRLEAAVREILLAVGEDPDREGLAETPDRVARMYAELFSGAGWRLTRVVPTRSPTSVIEGEAV